MSQIDDLIAEYCPNGVQRRPLASVGTLRRGRRFVKTDIVETGVPCIHYGEIYTRYGTSANRTFSFLAPELAARLRTAEPGDVIIASAGETIEDIGKAVAWLGTEKVVIHDACYAFHSHMDPRFVAYFLQTADFRKQVRPFISSSKISAVSLDNLGKILIPTPSIEIQREVVRIVETFSELEAELEVQLNAELEARRRQYSFYSELLLSKQHSGVLRRGFLYDAVSLVIDHRGKTPRKLGGDWVSNGHRVISALNIRNGKVDDNDHHYISESMYARWMSQPLRAGDVLMTSEAPLGSVAFVEKDLGWAIGQRLFALRPRPEVLHGRFLYHLLRAGAPRRELLARSTGSTVSGIRQAELMKVELALPTTVEQERIVTILDSFEALINDLSIGLPAELAARRKQYAYYRNRLLTFEELAS